MKTKIDIQNTFFNSLQALDLPEIQSRFIAYKLADFGNKEIVKAEIKGSTLNIICESNKYKTEILSIDIPANSIEKIL